MRTMGSRKSEVRCPKSKVRRLARAEILIAIAERCPLHSVPFSHAHFCMGERVGCPSSLLKPLDFFPKCQSASSAKVFVLRVLERRSNPGCSVTHNFFN